MGSMWLLYQLAWGLALLVAAPFLLLRRGRHYLATLPGRLGNYPDRTWAGGEGGLWIHAVSVGEVAVAATLARALPQPLPLLVTTVTPTGQARARAAFQGRGEVAYLPLDLGFAIERFFRRFAPKALVLIEGDLWPLLLRAAQRRALPVVVVNGRVSDRGFARMRRLRWLLRPLLSRVDRFGVQSPYDRERLLALGVAAERVIVTGNLKYESPQPIELVGLDDRLRRLAAGRPILIAGSTMAGEEEEVLDAFAHVGGASRALLLLVPRHPERWPEVEELLRRRGLESVRRSALEHSEPSPETAVVLIDSLGELAGLYALGAAAFIGGTLAPTGGHNPLEPARFALPIAVGSSTENFREIAEQFDAAGAWRRVGDGRDLGAAWSEWISDPAVARAQGQRAAALLEANRGALQRTLHLLGPTLRQISQS